MIAKVSKVIFVIVAARFYGPVALGLYFLAWSTVDIASKFGMWGLDRNLIRAIPRYRADTSEHANANLVGVLRFSLSLALGLSLTVAVLLLVSAPFIAAQIFKNVSLVAPLRVLTIALPLIVMGQLLISMTRALRIMRYDVLIRQTLEPLILLIAALTLLPLKLGAVGLAMAHGIAGGCAAVAAGFAVFREYRHLGWRARTVPTTTKKAMVRFSSSVGVMDFFYLSASRIDLMLVGGMIGAAAVGVYGIAIEIISIIKRVRQGFEPIYSPIVSDLLHRGHQERLRRSYTIVTRWLMAGTLLPVIVLVLFSSEILSLFSDTAIGASGALIILACSHGIFGIFSASENLLLMSGKSFIGAVLAAGMFVVNIVATVLLIPVYGIAGAAAGMLAAHIFVSVARLACVYKYFGAHPFKAALLWPLATAVITGGMFALLKSHFGSGHGPSVILILAIMVLSYGAIYLAGAKEPDERYFIDKLKSKLLRNHK